MEKIIQKIQFKRGSQQSLEENLVHGSEYGVLAQGEPAYEINTNRFKIGDGIHDYKDLEYIGGSSGLDPRFEIADPENGQVLVYSQEKGKWVNKESLFAVSTQELINRKVYNVLWRVKPTSTNTVTGVATDPNTGETFEIKSTNGIITADKFTSTADTIPQSEIEKLFN